MSPAASRHPSLADRFRYFVPTFTAGPAPLYAYLARCAAEQLERPTPNPFRRVLLAWDEEPPRRFLPLRLLAVVHRWVLAGDLPALALHYRSVGGIRPPEGSWPKFLSAVLERSAELPELLEPPLQHNEPSRAAALTTGFLQVALETGMPLRLLEVGTSAGLLLRWDHYRRTWWFQTMFDAAPPLEVHAEVLERRGCDLFPIDPTVPENEVRLMSYVWADLAPHVQILREAIDVCRRVPATIDRADGAEWLEDQLGQPRSGVATVVFHSLMRASGPQASLHRMTAALERAAAVATPEAPLAHLRFEAPDNAVVSPAEARGLVDTTLTLWPDGTERVLVTSDVNGRHVKWLE
jgi:hypothetical protein